MYSYRFIVKGEENWLKFKDIINGFNHTMFKKFKDECGYYMYIASLNDIDLPGIREAIKMTGAKCYSNNQIGCMNQFKDEVEGMNLSTAEVFNYGYVRTNQIMDTLVRLGVM